MKTAILSVIAVAVLTAAGAFLSGCGAYKGAKGTNPAAVQPVNSFEGYAYQALSDAEAGLNATAAKIKSGELPKSLTADYDRAAVLYNTLVTLLNRYDAAFRAGSDVTAIQNEISQDLADLISLGLKLWPKK
jgi:hypothetical protein